VDGANEAVAEPVAWGLGIGQSFGQRFVPVGLKSGQGEGDFDATGEHTSEVETQPTRSGVSKVWLRLSACPVVIQRENNNPKMAFANHRGNAWNLKNDLLTA
jgi:hypothetical protein